VSLSKYGIQIIDNPKGQLIQKKRCYYWNCLWKDKFPNVTISQYLSDKLNFRYGYLTTMFFWIYIYFDREFYNYSKIERAKKMIIEENLP
jgi:hypothetical protein